MAERESVTGCEVPAAYGRGRASFMGLDLLVAPGVLVPRPETELLARAAITFLNTIPAGESVRVVDVCCGSGNLACAVAAAVPAADVWATDLTDPCVDLTRRNVRELGLGDRVRVFQGDLYAPLAGEGLDGQADAVTCNPPYIPTKLLDDRADLRAEPREAFDGGPFGLSILIRVLQEAPRLLRPGGRLFVEVGPREERHAVQLVERSRAYTDLVLLRTADGTIHAVHARRV